MAEPGGGAIVNTAAESAIVGMPGLASYAASKHGVVGLRKSVALEYATRGMRVTAIAPGPTERNIAANFGANDGIESLSVDTSAMSEVPMHPLASLADVAGVVAFRCSDDGASVTGHTVPVDGGQHAE
jgi:NAD(P)-dependent dehydrogenase (short-subunit alcohol dehydrogenase family)